MSRFKEVQMTPEQQREAVLKLRRILEPLAEAAAKDPHHHARIFLHGLAHPEDVQRIIDEAQTPEAIEAARKELEERKR